MFYTCRFRVVLTCIFPGKFDSLICLKSLIIWLPMIRIKFLQAEYIFLIIAISFRSYHWCLNNVRQRISDGCRCMKYPLLNISPCIFSLYLFQILLMILFVFINCRFNNSTTTCNQLTRRTGILEKKEIKFKSTF